MVINKLLLVFLYELIPASAVFGWGSCPEIPTEDLISLKSEGFIYSQGTFDALSYLGVWHAYFRTVDFPYSSGDCARSYYFLTQDGRVGAQLSDRVDGFNKSATAEVFIHSDIQGQLSVKVFRFAPAGDYRIVHTDYKNTALIISCRSIYLSHWKYAWVLVRDTSINPPEFYTRIVEEYGIRKSELVKVKHEGCSA
jgi:hypothetical protein